MATGVRTRSVQPRSGSNAADFALAFHADEYDGKNRPVGKQPRGHPDFSGGDRGLCEMGGVGEPDFGNLADRLALDPGLRSFPRDAFQHRRRSRGLLPRRARTVLAVRRRSNAAARGWRTRAEPNVKPHAAARLHFHVDGLPSPYQVTPYFEAMARALASSDCQLRPPLRAAFFFAGLAAVLGGASGAAAVAGAAGAAAGAAAVSGAGAAGAAAAGAGAAGAGAAAGRGGGAGGAGAVASSA